MNQITGFIPYTSLLVSDGYKTEQKEEKVSKRHY